MEEKRKAPGLSCEKRNTLRGISNNAKEQIKGEMNEKGETEVENAMG